MYIKAVTEQFDVSADTVRYYTRLGLLNPRKHPDNGYKEYGASDLNRLKFILNARKLGFSLEDIQGLLAQADQGESPCAQARQLIEVRLSEVQRRIDELTLLRDEMRNAVKHWQTQPDKPPSENLVCHLIDSFSRQRSETTGDNV